MNTDIRKIKNPCASVYILVQEIERRSNMAEAVTQEQMNEALFMQLVMMFQGAAMQQIGKIVNPISGKAERDLDQAKMSIDILGMLQEKTKGNVSENERKFLDHVLFELRMNYVDEVNKAKKEKEEEKAEKPEEKDEEKKEKAEKPKEQGEGKKEEEESSSEKGEESKI